MVLAQLAPLFPLVAALPLLYYAYEKFQAGDTLYALVALVLALALLAGVTTASVSVEYAASFSLP